MIQAFGQTLKSPGRPGLIPVFFEVQLMSLKSKFTLIVLSASLAVYTIAGAWLATRAQQPANDPGAQQKIFENVLQHIQNDYLDEPNIQNVPSGAFRALASGLDPSSTLLPP